MCRAGRRQAREADRCEIPVVPHVAHERGFSLRAVEVHASDPAMLAKERPEVVRDLGIGRKIYVHINNSNPVLDEASEERRTVEAAGWAVGYDGMEVRL